MFCHQIILYFCGHSIPSTQCPLDWNICRLYAFSCLCQINFRVPRLKWGDLNLGYSGIWVLGGNFRLETNLRFQKLHCLPSFPINTLLILHLNHQQKHYTNLSLKHYSLLYTIIYMIYYFSNKLVAHSIFYRSLFILFCVYHGVDSKHTE